jgi:hypothetical protein
VTAPLRVRRPPRPRIYFRLSSNCRTPALFARAQIMSDDSPQAENSPEPGRRSNGSISGHSAGAPTPNPRSCVTCRRRKVRRPCTHSTSYTLTLTPRCRSNATRDSHAPTVCAAKLTASSQVLAARLVRAGSRQMQSCLSGSGAWRGSCRV